MAFFIELGLTTSFAIKEEVLHGFFWAESTIPASVGPPKEIYQDKTTKSPGDPRWELGLTSKAGLSFPLNSETALQLGVHSFQGFTKMREVERLSEQDRHVAYGLFLGMMTQLKKT